MGLSYVVLTMVTRDDLEDGGGRHVAAVIESLRRKIPEVRVEALVSDLGGSIDSLELLLASRPDVFNHNIETVPRLYPEVRSRASYTRSLALLERASSARPCLPVKSGFMVGLGETEEEIVSLMKDIRSTGCRILTIGQYLRPSNQNLAVKSFVSPEKFQEFEALGREMGFHIVYSGPLVRSSYLAAEAYEKLRKGGNC
jgi:lipoic acid synthetase